MNNASLVIWRISNLGLQCSPAYESTPSIFSTIWRSKQAVSTPFSHSRCPLHTQTTWAARKTQSSKLGCLYGPGLTLKKELRRAFSSDSILQRRSTPHSKAAPIIPAHTTNAIGARSAVQHISEAHPNQLKPLSLATITKIFGPAVTLATGNKVLQTLQKQRITGRLDEGITAPGVDEVLVMKALAWLRMHLPYDEDAAIMRRIEEEDSQIEPNQSGSQLVARAEKIGLYKPQQNVDPQNVYGRSALEQIREEAERKEAERQQEEEKREAEKQQAIELTETNQDGLANTGMVQQASGRAVLARRSESAEWVKRYKEKAQIEGLVFDKLSRVQQVARLIPSLLFCMGVVWVCVLLAQNYEPPPRHARLWQDVPPAVATILGLVSLNLMGFVAWRMPPMWRFMNKFFLIIPARPRVWSMLGNVFSHQTPAHLFGNMIVLYFIGTRLCDDIGRGNFLAIYLSSGVLGSFVSLSRLVITNNFVTTSLGASGALTGVLAAWCSIHAGEQFKIRFIPPEWGPLLSLNLLFVVLIACEVVGIYRGVYRLDHWAHLGGYASGFAGAMAMKHRARRRREERLRSNSLQLTGKGEVA